MPRDLGVDLREKAERRVRTMQARQSADLVKWQLSERQKDFRAQKQALGQLTEKETAQREERRKALERLDRQWQQQRDKLGSAAIPAPAFGLLPPARNLQQEYMRAREQYEVHRNQLTERFHERLADYQRERSDKLHEFHTANQVRDRVYSDARIDLTERQNKSFERLVRKDMEPREKSLNREFTRRSRVEERQI